MQQVVGSQRLLATQQSGVRTRPRHQLVAFTGFKRANAVLLGTNGSSGTLQAHVSKAINAAARKSGVKCMRVTRMMFERFTEKAIKVVMLAQEEARRLGHNFVGTEQILLGLIGESTGTLAALIIRTTLNTYHFIAHFTASIFPLKKLAHRCPLIPLITSTHIPSTKYPCLSFPFSTLHDRYRCQSPQIHGHHFERRSR